MLLSSITLKNILSFKEAKLELEPLNLLIGPNASGKSNLVEAIGLLQAAPVDFNRAIGLGGGVRQWLWKGGKTLSPIAQLACEVAYEPKHPFRYELEFSEYAQGLMILRERLGDEVPHPGRKAPTAHFDRVQGQVAIGGLLPGNRQPSRADVGPINVHESVLSRFRSPIDPSPITQVGSRFEQIKIYREFRTGPNSGARTGVSTSVLKESLADGGENLAVVLNEMHYNGSLPRVEEYLKRLCDQFDGVTVRLDGGTAQTYIRESNLLEPTSAVRLSDGTLKFLCLLAVLLNPKNAPLVCIEEPELGLHPDALRLVAEALSEASQRMQLVVTTHSEALVNAFSDRPEAVLVCERDFDYGTQFQRLTKQKLAKWLERYSLGELWRKGEIGGNRW